MRPTRPGSLLLGGLVAMLVILVLSRRDHALTPPPGAGAVAMGLLGVGVLAAARSLRVRLSGRPGSTPITPLAVARLAVLGVASAISGSVVAGGWLGLLLDRLVRLGGNPAARHDALVAGGGVMSGVVLVAGGVALQRLARAAR